MQIQIKPQGKMVLVEATKPDGGAIAIPNFTPEDAQRVHQRGVEIYRILAVGEGRLMSDGKFIPYPFKPGDEVLLAPDTPLAGPAKSLFGIEGQYIIDGTNVIALVEGRDGNKLPTVLPEIVKGSVLPRKALVQ